jgi:hypothetical protein
MDKKKIIADKLRRIQELWIEQEELDEGSPELAKSWLVGLSDKYPDCWSAWTVTASLRTYPPTELLLLMVYRRA